MEITAVYNPRKPNGDLSDIACNICGCLGSAYVELKTSVYHRPYEIHKTLVCKGCLGDWEQLINESILQDVMDSVKRRGKTH